MELEGEVKALDARIAAAKAVQAPVDRNRIVFTLNWLREGDPMDKEYQRRLIDTFVKAVYLNEKEIKIDYYYAGGDNSRSVPLSDLEPVPGGDGGPVESECSSKVPSAPPRRKTPEDNEGRQSRPSFVGQGSFSFSPRGRRAARGGGGDGARRRANIKIGLRVPRDTSQDVSFHLGPGRRSGPGTDRVLNGREGLDRDVSK